MANDNNVLVVAYYGSTAEAEQAADALKEWDDANDDIKLGAIAVLTLHPNTGEIQAHEVGQRETKGGTLWGTAVGAAVGLLSGGIGLIPGMLLGAGGGAAVGAMKTKSVEMDEQDRLSIANQLRNGLTGLAVMADDFEVDATMAKMIALGGQSESYRLAAETAEAVAEAALVQTAAAEAVDEATDAPSDTVDELLRAFVWDAPDADEATDEAIDEAADASSNAVDELVRAFVWEAPEVDEEETSRVVRLAAALDVSFGEAARLSAAQIDKVSTFYKQGATPEGRAALSEATGLDADTILTIEKKLDLMRIKGIGPKYAALLIVAGVATVPDLAQRNPGNLTSSLSETNEAHRVVDGLPGEHDVQNWVVQAQELPRVVVY